METKQFLPEEFDIWAESYDEHIQDETIFPFVGYRQLFNTMIQQAAPLAEKKILDLGCGTGSMAGFLFGMGVDIWSTDFSESMIRVARQKYPKLPFVVHDLRDPLPETFAGKYDRITSAYVFHHFPLEEKMNLLRGYMEKHLVPGGFILIGDLAFQNEAALQKVKNENTETWDDEYYWILETDLPVLEKAGFNVSVITINEMVSLIILKT